MTLPLVKQFTMSTKTIPLHECSHCGELFDLNPLPFKSDTERVKEGDTCFVCGKGRLRLRLNIKDDNVR